jgi:predicted nucleic acid-binding Zn ribbon protein
MPPFYLYRCPRCDAEVEEMRPMDDANRDRPICENGDVPMVMDLVIAPVPGIVRNPAAGPRRSKP